MPLRGIRLRVYEHEAGLCTAIVRNPGPEQSRWEFEVDPQTLGRTKVTDPDGKVTSATFNDRGQPVTVTTDQGTTEIAYDQGLPIEITDISGTTTIVTYEAGSDRVATISRPILGTLEPPTPAVWSVEVFYDDVSNPGLPTRVIDPRGKTWTYQYDGTGDLVAAADPMGGTTSWTYNEVGWPLSVVEPLGSSPGGQASEHTTAFSYDLAGGVAAVADPAGGITEYGADLSGLLEWVRDPVGVGEPAEETDLVWNATGELVAVERADGSLVETEYWPDGSVKLQRSAAAQETAYGYDGQGRLSSVTDPAGRVTAFGYTRNGRLEWKQQPGGDCGAAFAGCIRYSYPAPNEFRIDYSDPATNDVYMGWSHTNRMAQIGDGNGGSFRYWDSLGRLSSSSDAGGSVAYGYADPGPSPTTISYGNGKTIQRTHDDAGRVSSVTDWLGGTTSFGWDPNSNLAAVDTPATAGVEDEFAYDRANRPTAQTIRQGSTTLAALGTARDAEGMVRSATGTGIAGAVDEFDYDQQDRLVSDLTGGYSFDAADNLTGFPDGRRQRFDAANQLCYVATTNDSGCGAPPLDAMTFSYDGRGNRTSSTTPDAVTTTYAYDGADRLRSATIPGVVDTGDPAGQYTPLDPAVVADTVNHVGLCPTSTCNKPAAGGTLTIQVAGRGGVPSSGAAAVVLNVSTKNPTSDGSLTTYPSGINRPATETLRYEAGEEQATATVVKLPADGRVKLYTTAATDLVVSVEGWYAAPTGAAESEFYPMDPSRLVDSRQGHNVGTCPTQACTTWPMNSARDVQIAGSNGIPASGVTAVVLNVFALNRDTAAGTLTAYTPGTTRPPTPNLLWDNGGEDTNLVVAKLDANGRVRIHTSRQADVLIDVAGYYQVGSGGTGSDFVIPDSPIPRHDSRSPQCVHDCQRIVAQQARTLVMAGVNGVPADATAVMVNLTLYPRDGAGNPNVPASLHITPTGAAWGVPAARFEGYDPVSASAIVKLGTNGAINLYSYERNADYVLDVVGWYTPNQGGPATFTYDYSFDGLRRTKTHPNGTISRYLWDRSGPLPLLLAEHFDAPGTASDKTVRYVYDPRGLVLEDITSPPGGGTETVRWYHHDQLGSTRALTDHTGSLLATFGYTPYGEPAAGTGTATTPIGWAGEYRDTETGLVYLRARYYDPTTAQFLTRDPLESVTRDPYGYAFNNPVNLTDPTGMAPWDGFVDFFVGSGCDGDGLFGAIGSISDQDIANFAGGVLNAITFGNGNTVAGWAGVEDRYDTSSGWYFAGEVAGLAVPAGGVRASGIGIKGFTYPNARGVGVAITRHGGQLIRADVHFVKIRQSYRFVPRSWVGERRMLPHLHIGGSGRHWPFQTLRPR